MSPMDTLERELLDARADRGEARGAPLVWAEAQRRATPATGDAGSWAWPYRLVLVGCLLVTAFGVLPGTNGIFTTRAADGELPPAPPHLPLVIGGAELIEVDEPGWTRSLSAGLPSEAPRTVHADDGVRPTRILAVPQPNAIVSRDQILSDLASIGLDDPESFVELDDRGFVTVDAPDLMVIAEFGQDPDTDVRRYTFSDVDETGDRPLPLVAHLDVVIDDSSAGWRTIVNNLLLERPETIEYLTAEVDGRSVEVTLLGEVAAVWTLDGDTFVIVPEPTGGNEVALTELVDRVEVADTAAWLAEVDAAEPRDVIDVFGVLATIVLVGILFGSERVSTPRQLIPFAFVVMGVMLSGLNPLLIEVTPTVGRWWVAINLALVVLLVGYVLGVRRNGWRLEWPTIAEREARDEVEQASSS